MSKKSEVVEQRTSGISVATGLLRVCARSKSEREREREKERSPGINCEG